MVAIDSGAGLTRTDSSGESTTISGCRLPFLTAHQEQIMCAHLGASLRKIVAACASRRPTANDHSVVSPIRKAASRERSRLWNSEPLLSPDRIQTYTSNQSCSSYANGCSSLVLGKMVIPDRHAAHFQNSMCCHAQWAICQQHTPTNWNHLTASCGEARELYIEKKVRPGVKR